MTVEDWDYQRPRRGEVRDGTILAIHDQEIIVDVGARRDGIVPYADLQRMDPGALQELRVGDSVPVYVLRPEDQEGNLLVSLYLARQSAAWKRAQELAESGEVWEAEVEGYNKGGLVVPIGDVRGFVPASQIPGFPMGMSQEDRLGRLSKLVGEKLPVKVIEINRRKRRLILSAQAGQEQWRQRQRERLLEELREGEVRRGLISSLAPFGAFVDLGGADGLVHLSELSWRRVRHPKEVVRVGDEVEVLVLRLDEASKQILLSLKRLEPEPWALVENRYELGQLVEGVVTNVVDFGAFAEIDEGIEGLIHVSELADTPISHPKEVVKKGDLLLLRIIRIDAGRKRLGLSLKCVLESEWAEWAAQLSPATREDVEVTAPEPQAETAKKDTVPEVSVPLKGPTLGITGVPFPEGTFEDGTQAASNVDVASLTVSKPREDGLVCPKCGVHAKETARFCSSCGFKLEARTALPPMTILQQRYTVVRQIGGGGMSRVYQALDTRLGNALRAVKEILTAQQLDVEDRAVAIELFRREAEILARLDHPNLPKVYDYFLENGEYYLIMDFVAGQDLRSILEHQSDALAEEIIVGYIVQLCDVLEYLHDQTPPVIFRDLKPGNIMVTPRGTLKLVDFGIARFFEPQREKDTRAMGTPGYAAPEQYGHAQTDPRADIYSLGVVFHELLTGFDPSETPFNLPPLCTLNPRVSAGLEGIIERATSVDLNQRYPSAREFRDALAAVLPRRATSRW